MSNTASHPFLYTESTTQLKSPSFDFRDNSPSPPRQMLLHTEKREPRAPNCQTDKLTKHYENLVHKLKIKFTEERAKFINLEGELQEAKAHLVESASYEL